MKCEVAAARAGKYKAAALGVLLLLSLPSARAWDVGIINTWIHGDSANGVGTSHGLGLMVRQEVWRYADVGARASYMKSDCFKVDYVPLELTASLKYPLADDRFVPFLGVGVGYYVFTGGDTDLRNKPSWFPMIGCDWFFGEQKKWSLYAEIRYEYMKTHVDSGPKQGSTARFTGPGGSWGFSYRF